jgi:hypothetical protein
MGPFRGWGFMKVIAALISLAVLSGCTDTARIFPMDDVAMASYPKLEFAKQGLSHRAAQANCGALCSTR